MTAPISDEAARALLNARYGEPVTSTGDFLPASYERAKAEIAAVAPLLVSAEAERGDDYVKLRSDWAIVTAQLVASRAVVEGLRAELTEQDAKLRQAMRVSEWRVPVKDDEVFTIAVATLAQHWDCGDEI